MHPDYDAGNNQYSDMTELEEADAIIRKFRKKTGLFPMFIPLQKVLL